MNVRYRVTLTEAERAELTTLVAGGKGAVRMLKRAQILLAADRGQTDEAIAASVSVGTSTVYRTKRRFVEGNLQHALQEEPRPGARRKLSGKEEALLVAQACSAPPPGRARWTLELLAGAMVALTDHEDLSRETVRRRLAENKLKPWRQEMWCIPEVNAEYVARMEDVLDLYAESPDPLRPVVCFDESPTQLIGESREPIPARPGQLQRFDFEYVRNGTVNLFVFLDAHRPWRHVKITDHRTAVDFAICMRDLVDVHYPAAERIRVVLDNLSTHSYGALYEAFPPEEARRILRKLEFHFVPKHASWLNMVEIEIGVLRNQCLDRRIPERDLLESEVAAWLRQRNESGARIEWMFTTERARAKMGRAYPAIPVANVPGSKSDAAPTVPSSAHESAQVSVNPAPPPAHAKPTPDSPTRSSSSGSPPGHEASMTPVAPTPSLEHGPTGELELTQTSLDDEGATARPRPRATPSRSALRGAPRVRTSKTSEVGKKPNSRKKPSGTRPRSTGPRTNARPTEAQLAPRKRRWRPWRPVKTPVRNY